MTDNSSVAFQNCNLCTSLSAKVHWIGDYTISCYRYDDDSTGILTTEKGIKIFLYLINLFGKASGHAQVVIVHVFTRAENVKI